MRTMTRIRCCDMLLLPLALFCFRFSGETDAAWVTSKFTHRVGLSSRLHSISSVGHDYECGGFKSECVDHSSCCERERSLIDRRRRQVSSSFCSDQNNRRSVLTTLTAGLLGVAPWISPPPADATPEVAGLKPPTEDHPKIPFPDITSLKQQDASLEGLLYLKNPRSARRPTASDVLILTVRTIQQPDVVIGGAKVPVARIRSFPVRFQITANNAVVSTSSASAKDVWNDALSNSDLLVQAVVCDRDIVMAESSKGENLTVLLNTCGDRPDGIRPVTGQGIAKLVRLSQNSDETTTIIRAPVSLPLE